MNSLINRKDDLSTFLLGNLIEKEQETKPLPVVAVNKVLEICDRYLQAVSAFDSLVFSSQNNEEKDSSPHLAESVVDLTESGDEMASPSDESPMPSDEFKMEPSKISSLLLGPYSALCAAQLNVGRGKIKTEGSTPPPVLSFLSVITLGASVCFHAYIKECSTAVLAPVHTKPRPPFMAELNAGRYRMNLSMSMN